MERLQLRPLAGDEWPGLKLQFKSLNAVTQFVKAVQQAKVKAM